MLNSQKLTIRSSEIRARLNELSAIDTLTAENRTELDALTNEYRDTETKLRAALISEGDAEKRALATEPDAERRERLELRGKASLTAYLRAALAGRRVDGAELELQSAAKIGDGIPLELWDTAPAAVEKRQTDAPTVAPGTVGINLDMIRPAVFSQSVLPRLGVEMPRVESGTYASATISTSLTSASKAAGARQDATAAAFTVSSVTPKRISARLAIRIEDIAAAGTNLESALRENLSLVLSDQLDRQGLNGAGSGSDLNGIFQALTDPTVTPTDIATFDAFASVHAGGIDGLWALTLRDVAVVCGPATYALGARTFQSATNYKGEMSAASYAMNQTGGFWTNSRMPDAVSTVQQAILYRMGRSMMGGSGAECGRRFAHSGTKLASMTFTPAQRKVKGTFTMHVVY